MLATVIWKWHSHRPDWIEYSSDAVNHLANQVHRFVGVEHKVFCITDDAAGLDNSIEPIPLKEMHCPLPVFNKYSHRLHSAYRRLKIFDPVVAKFFGNRILQLDIDMVIAGDISHITTRAEPFLIWKCYSHGKNCMALNPSFILFDVGAKTAVNIWKKYCISPHSVAKKAYDAGWTGTEQAVIGFLTRDNEPQTLDERDGIYSFRDNPKECAGDELAPEVKVVSFHGGSRDFIYNPADPELQRQCKWLDKVWKESGDHVCLLPVGNKIQAGICERPETDDQSQLHAAP